MGADDYPDWEEFMRTSFAARHEFPLLAPETPSFMAQPIAATARTCRRGRRHHRRTVCGGLRRTVCRGRDGAVDLRAKASRQQSARYPSGYVQDFDLDVFEHIRMVDYGDADIPSEVMNNQTAENVLAAQAAVESKVNDALERGPCPWSSARTARAAPSPSQNPAPSTPTGRVGCVSLDTHWDAHELDYLTGDPRIAGSSSWKHKMYEFLDNMHPRHLVEIGERGMLEEKRIVRRYLSEGARSSAPGSCVPALGIEGLVAELDRAWDGTEGVYVHFDMDCIGGAGPRRATSWASWPSRWG